MRVSEPVQAPVGLDHRAADPGAGRAFTGRGAAGKDLVERRIEARFIGTIAQDFPEGAGDLELRRNQDHARVRAPPQDRIAFREPGKDAVAIGLKQTLAGQIGACGKQPVRILERRLDRREGRVALQPGIIPLSALHLLPAILRELAHYAAALDDSAGMPAVIESEAEFVTC